MAKVDPNAPIKKPGEGTVKRHLNLLNLILRNCAAGKPINTTTTKAAALSSEAVEACVDLSVIAHADIEGAFYRWIYDGLPDAALAADVYRRAGEIRRGAKDNEAEAEPEAVPLCAVTAAEFDALSGQVESLAKDAEFLRAEFSALLDSLKDSNQAARRELEGA